MLVSFCPEVKAPWKVGSLQLVLTVWLVILYVVCQCCGAQFDFFLGSSFLGCQGLGTLWKPHLASRGKRALFVSLLQPLAFSEAALAE